MTTETREINGQPYTVITADEGKILSRKHDGFAMGRQVILGIDYSTGEPREDRPEYYEEVDAPPKREPRTKNRLER